MASTAAAPETSSRTGDCSGLVVVRIGGGSTVVPVEVKVVSIGRIGGMTRGGRRGG